MYGLCDAQKNYATPIATTIQLGRRGGFGTCAASLQPGSLRANIQFFFEQVVLNTGGANYLAFGPGADEVHLVETPDAHEGPVHSASELDKLYLQETAKHFVTWHLAGHLAQLPLAGGCCRMFGIFGKQRLTTNELAQQLASAFAKSTLSAFDEPYTMQTSALWAAHCDGAQSRKAAVREWLVFNLASYMDGCISSMGTNDVNRSLLRHFIFCIAEEVSALGVFDTADEFMQLGRERTQQYQSAVVLGNPELSLQKIARLFLETTGRAANDAALLAAAAGAFTGRVVASKAMFDTLQNEFRIDAD